MSLAGIGGIPGGGAENIHNHMEGYCNMDII